MSDVGRKPRYGLYGVKVYLLSFAFLVFLGAAITASGVMTGSLGLRVTGFCVILYGAISTIGWLLGRYVIPGGPVTFSQGVVVSLGLNGSETVLDVGTGRGLYAIEMAKKVTTGRVVAIDLWEPHNAAEKEYHHKWAQPTGNTIGNARLNARLEGVEEKVTFLNMDANRLKFPRGTFDLVVCAYVIGHLGDHGKKVLAETNRVLKPGGRLLIIDNVRDLTFFFMSTPHLFVLSYLRGKKARRLTRRYWLTLIAETGYRLNRMRNGKGIILLEATPAAT